VPKLYHVALPAKLLGGISAFTPNLTRPAASGAQQYKRGVVGQPGTQGIPAPTQNTQISPDAGDKAQMGWARSSDAPDTWYPQLWYQSSLYGAPGPVTPVKIYSDNMMPVPAKDPRGLPTLLAIQPHFLGQSQIAQPRTMPWWGANV
jgi:hypothetical protein